MNVPTSIAEMEKNSLNTTKAPPFAAHHFDDKTQHDQCPTQKPTKLRQRYMYLHEAFRHFLSASTNAYLRYEGRNHCCGRSSFLLRERLLLKYFRGAVCRCFVFL